MSTTNSFFIRRKQSIWWFIQERVSAQLPIFQIIVVQMVFGLCLKRDRRLKSLIWRPPNQLLPTWLYILSSKRGSLSTLFLRIVTGCTLEVEYQGETSVNLNVLSRSSLMLKFTLIRYALSEVHGNMFVEVCKRCKPMRPFLRLFDVTEKTNRNRHATGRRCHICGQGLFDTIVHFGERYLKFLFCSSLSGHLKT